MNKPCQLDGSNIIYDEDSKLTQLQIEALIQKIFSSKKVKKIGKQFIINNKTALLVKNITWLGYDKQNDDYRVDKKRIQLSKDYSYIAKSNLNNGIKTYFIGIYSYEKEKDFLYAVFETEKYVDNKSNNSSAHLSIYDLVSAKNRGYFFKTDKFENKILILDTNNFKDFIINENSEVYKIASAEYQLLQYFKKFWDDIPLELQGDRCYREMFDAAFSKTFETEWVGWYHEFLFENFLRKEKTDLVDLYADCSRDGFNLDLKMNIGNNFFGDLKSDNENFDIQGNKKETIDTILDKNGHIWYLVASFNEVVMDKTMEYMVMKEYNRLKEEHNSTCNIKSKKKKINMDYSEKMKYSVKLNNFYILDINPSNAQFLLDYKQGKNSDGKSRGVKYKISKKTLDEFKIFEYNKTKK